MNMLFRKWIIPLLLMLPIGAWSQTNLVPNPGFENTTPQVFNYVGGSKDFPCVDVCPTSGFISLTRNGRQHDYWSTCANWTLPFHSFNSSLFPVASPDVLCSNTKTGDYCGQGIAGGPNYTEYLTVVTTTALLPTHRYYFEVWIKQSNSAVETIPAGEYGIGLHTFHPKQNGDKHIVPPMEITSGTDIITSPDEYVLFSGTFVPNSIYNYISIGQFHGNSGYWLLIDDIMIAEMGLANCPPSLLIENRNYAGTTLRDAASTIRAGFDVGFIGTNDDVIVNSGATVDYKAGEEIRLEPGFSSVSGSDFHAYIDDCASPPRKTSDASEENQVAVEFTPLIIRYNDVDESLESSTTFGETEDAGSMDEMDLLDDMIKVYPVPFHSEFTLNTSTDLDLAIVRDISGRVVWTANSLLAGENTINLSNSASGIYMLEVHSNQSMFRTKITKQ